MQVQYFGIVGNAEAKTRRLLGIFCRVLHWERAAVIKSLTKAVIHCSLSIFRGQCLEMETNYLGDDLKQSMQMKYSGISRFPHYTSPNPISITAQILGQRHQEPLQTKGESLSIWLIWLTIREQELAGTSCYTLCLTESFIWCHHLYHKSL